MRVLFLASVSALSLSALTTNAWAQTAPPARAASQAPANGELVITAEKRTERLQDAPVAAAVVSTQTLATTNSTDISDLNKLVPSLTLNGSFNGRVPYAIRGISTDSNEQAVGIASGVAVMVDGVPVPSDNISANQLADIDHVEVLKGPQATLGGRTAAAGVINFVTQSPKDMWSANAGGAVTTDGEFRLNGFITGPIANNLDFSLSAYGHHVDYPIDNRMLGEKSDADAFGGRLKLLFRPSENLDITLMGHMAGVNAGGGNLVYLYVTPGATLLFPGSPFNQALLMPGITPSFKNRDYTSPVTQAGAWTYDDDASLNINYRLGGLTLTSTTAYQYERQTNVQDLFADAVYFWNVLTGGFAPPFYNYQTQHEWNSQWSEELKLVSPADQQLSWLAGFFYSDTSIHETYNRTLIPAAVDVDVTPMTATYDVYGRATFKITPTTSLIGGLRYNYDALKYVYTQNAYFPLSPPTYVSQGSNNSSALVGDVTLQQKLSTDWMVYGTYSRGYSPKAYNTAFPLASNATLDPVAAEHINHFEIGSKGSYLDHRLTLDLAAFYTIYQNYQIQTFSNNPLFLNPPLDLTAAGKAETRGVELDAMARPTDNLNINFNAAYIDAVFKSYPNAPCYGGQTAAQGCTVSPAGDQVQNVDGKTMPNSPKLRFDVSAEQRIPLEMAPFDLLIGGDYAYRTKAQMLADQNPQAVQPAYGVLNLHATLAMKSGKYSVTAFVNNVTDKVYYVDVEDFWSSVWSNTSTVVGQPARDAIRYFGVSFNAKF